MSLPVLGTAVPVFESRLEAQPRPSTIPVRSLNHFGLAVADPQRSIDFYQGLFGSPVQARMGTTAVLRVGDGPQFFSISPVEGNLPPRITHYGLGVEGFNVERVMKALADHGVAQADSVGPMKMNVATRNGRTDLVFGDPDGIVCRLQDVTYCGGSGPLGNNCAAEGTSKKGLIQLVDVNHLTIFSTDAARANAFYRNVFGFSTRSFQGPTSPTLAVGPTVQFLMMAGGGAGEKRTAAINHACWTVRNFNVDSILKSLETFGLKPRGDAQGPVGQLRHYVTMRMENRGGAPEGTAELYFTDPDGLLMQLQDTRYCGGGGVLGSQCL
jgi:catechol 2,3-dioxygenase-like lactoylglutathione lyase family enzyme